MAIIFHHYRMLIKSVDAVSKAKTNPEESNG